MVTMRKTGLFLWVLFAALDAHAQFAVTDMGVQVQAALAAANTLKQLTNQAIQMKRDLDFRIKQGKTLADLGWQKTSFRDYINFVRGIKGNVNSLLRNYETIDRDFHRKTGSKDESFQERRKKWDAMTEESIRGSLMANGIVTEEENKHQAVDQLLNKLDSAENTLQATQAVGNLLEIQRNQLETLTTIVAADAHSKQIERSKTQSENRDKSSHVSHLAENWGQRKSSPPMKKMPCFSEIR